jgi:AcrR family transcriptional regulator
MTATRQEPTSSPARPTCMAADGRRELALAAATRSFARTGFAGTSTYAIAREAEVSQTYVTGIFGTKQVLSLATYDRAADTVHGAFAAAVGDPRFDGAREADRSRRGSVHTDLIPDHDLVLVLLLGFAAGNPGSAHEHNNAWAESTGCCSRPDCLPPTPETSSHTACCSQC